MFNDLNDTYENNSLSVSNLSLVSRFIFDIYLILLKETFFYKSKLYKNNEAEIGKTIRTN